MKIPFFLKCHKCKKGRTRWFNIDLDSLSYTCSCGCENIGEMPLSYTKGIKVLCRSFYEFDKKKDYALATVLAASALEIEIFRLHSKWFSINIIDEGRYETDEVIKNVIEEEFRKNCGIVDRMQKTSEYIVGLNFDEFVHSERSLKEMINSGFPSIKNMPPSKAIQEYLFWRRNAVLHYGKDISRQESIQSINYARLGINVFNAIDSTRRDKL